MIEGPYAEEWLYGILARDPFIMASSVQGRVYRARVAQDLDDASGNLLPAIRFFEAASNDMFATGAYRVWAEMFYQVEVMDRSDSVQHMRSVADRVDSLLHGSSGYVTGAWIVACTRNSSINYSIVDESIQYQHLGGLYRIRVQAWNGAMARFGAYARGV